jgi:hypothetical protein
MYTCLLLLLKYEARIYKLENFFTITVINMSLLTTLMGRIVLNMTFVCQLLERRAVLGIQI